MASDLREDIETAVQLVEEGYLTEEEAVAAIMAKAIPLSNSYEYGGIIYKKNDRYFASAPQTSRETHDINIRASKPKDADLVALYHTHPRGPRDDEFSKNDIETAKRLNVPYYMGHVRSGSHKKYDPRADAPGAAPMIGK